MTQHDNSDKFSMQILRNCTITLKPICNRDLVKKTLVKHYYNDDDVDHQTYILKSGLIVFKTLSTFIEEFNTATLKIASSLKVPQKQ